MAIFSKKESTAEETAKEQGGEKKQAHRHQGLVPGQAAKSAPVSGTIIPASLLGPRISEKASRLVNGNKYVFNVVKKVNKVEIKKAVEKTYRVKVTGVNVVNVKGKTRNTGRISGRTSSFKKAIVTLKQGDKIEGATETI